MSLFFKKLLIFTHILIFGLHVFAQENNIPIGDWRVHLSYYGLRSLDKAGSSLYAATTINGYYYNEEDKSINILSTINALNDIGIRKVRYHKDLDMLVLGYESGNIDILRNGTTININDIARKNIVGSKAINEINFFGNLAYISCDFGLAVLDLNKLEFRETYTSLAPSGLSNRVFSTCFSSDGDSIFIATEKGAMAARLASYINLMDYSNWYTYGPSQNLPATNVKGVINFNDRIYAAVDNDKLYYLSGNSWAPSSIPLDSDFRSFRISAGKLVICAGTRVIAAKDESDFTPYVYSFLNNPSEALFDTDGSLWIGDLVQGLYLTSGTSLQPVRPNGPLTNNVFKMAYFNNNIVVAAGGYNSTYGFSYNRAEYYVFNNQNWNTYNMYGPGFPDYSKARDLVSASYNPVNNASYFASYGFGVLEALPDNTYRVIDDTIAPFTRALKDPGPYVFITDAEVDKNGNLWVTNSNIPSTGDPSLHMRNTSGAWSSFKFPNTNTEASRYPIEVIIDDNNYKWVRLRPDRGGGLIVLNDKNNKYLYLTDAEGHGNLPKREVHAIVKDLKGDVWAGTEGGVAIFYNNQDVFAGADASTPLYDGFPLLYNESITCIEVDGGNRKWIGTRNGAWLLSDDGTEQIAYFNVDNSPLLSNIIIDIEINENTGEVFFATDKGIISYRGDATGSTKKHADVKIFPNPVKPDFKGTVGISGLTTDGSVKITDIYGNLVYQTKAEGGTATWNGKDYNGVRAEGGIYLIFSASEDGTESFVGKIAVVE